MIFTLGILALWSTTKVVHSAQLDIVPFAITGYSSVLLWRNAANRCGKAIEPNLSLLFHRNVRVIDIFTARVLLEIAGATTSLISLCLLFMAIGWMAEPASVLTMATGWLLLAWFALSLGFIIGPLSERTEIFDRVWHTLTYLMFPLSGTVFMVEWLPKAAQNFVLWVPMVHGVEMMRHGVFGSRVQTHEDPQYLILVNTIMLLIGLILMRETSRRVEPQ
jgi:capsular polysaccharide transport system permease protein